MLTSAMERLLFYGKTYAAHVIGTIDYKTDLFSNQLHTGQLLDILQ